MTHQRPDHTDRPPADASMSLLNEIMRNPLDLGYSAAARRRTRQDLAGASKTSSHMSRVVVLVVSLALGVTTTMAIKELRARDEVISSARTLLVDEITERQETRASLEELAAQRQQSVDQLRSQILEEQEPELISQVTTDQLRSGVLPVQGPGVKITVRDGSGADLDANRRVHDADIRVVVNGLWSLGAEAITINGQRLTTTSAIRSAGAAILVDLTGVSAPYRIEAIGDPDVFDQQFPTSAAAEQLEALNDSFGITWEIERQDAISAQAGSNRSLIHASPVTDESS